MSKKQVFDLLLQICKENGLKVYFRHLRSDTAGQYDWEAKTIVIDFKLKGTKRGLCVFAHELGHHMDFKNGRFKKFFYSDRMKYTPQNMRMAMLAEQSASRFSKNFLEKHGIQNVYLEELDPTQLPWLIAFWKKNYFYQKTINK